MRHLPEFKQSLQSTAIVLCCLLYTCAFASPPQNDLQINHADSLSINDSQVTLSGSVSVSLHTDPADGAGDSRFTLNTDSLIATQDASGAYNRVQTLSRGSISSQQFHLTADRFVFIRDGTGAFRTVEAAGYCHLTANSDADRQQMTAPHMLIDLGRHELIASGGVRSTYSTTQTNATLSSPQQTLDLQRKILYATDGVETTMDNAGEKFTLTSGKQELDLGSDERHRLIAMSETCHITTTNTNLNADNIDIWAQGQSVTDIYATGHATMHSNDSTITADQIDINKAHNTLFAHNYTENPDPVTLTAKEQQGFARKIYISQNKSDSTQDRLILSGEAQLIDTNTGRSLNGSQIEVNPTTKELFAGGDRFVHGSILMSQPAQK